MDAQNIFMFVVGVFTGIWLLSGVTELINNWKGKF